MTEELSQRIVDDIKSLFGSTGFVPLHEPKFIGNERAYVQDAIDSTIVSSVGKYVDRFEEMVRDYTGALGAVATANGTVALQLALLLCEARNCEVLTQALTFVGTVNAITHAGAIPVFIDSSRTTMGMCPNSLEEFLRQHTVIKNGFCYNRETGRRIAACVPMHTFGHPVEIERIVTLCSSYHIGVVEDAAESIGSFVGKTHTGLFGRVGILSFNGNKTITTGGGGMLVTNDIDLAKRAKHISTTAKVPHPWEFVHDEVGFNFRLPNLNAALGCAQMESLPRLLASKRELAAQYQRLFASLSVEFFSERNGTTANYWLNCIVLKDREERDLFLRYTNEHGVMTRPIWTLMSKLPMYAHCQSSDLKVAQWFEDRVVNIPSSPRV